VHGHILMNVSEFLPAYCQRDGHSEYGQSSLFVRLYRSLTSDSESLEAKCHRGKTMVDAAIQRFVQPFLNARFQS
jgi:hypothetical protein